MQQEPFFQPQEFAQAYRLGLLEDEYVTGPKKVLANFGLLLVFTIIAPIIVFGISLPVFGAAYTIYPIIFSVIFSTLGGGGFLLVLYLYYRHLHIYVYTYGLLYLNGNKSRVVYWQQIKRVSSNRGSLYISVRNESGLSIPSYVSRWGELRARIKQEIANHRNAG